MRGLHQIRGMTLVATRKHHVAAQSVLVGCQHTQELEACTQIAVSMQEHLSDGGMFKSAALRLKRLVVSYSTVDSLLQEMHWKARRRLERTVRMRRRLEHDSYQGRIQRRPLANKRTHGT